MEACRGSSVVEYWAEQCVSTLFKLLNIFIIFSLLARGHRRGRSHVRTRNHLHDKIGVYLSSTHILLFITSYKLLYIYFMFYIFHPELHGHILQTTSLYLIHSK